MIVAEESYETSEPAIDGHIVKLKASGADIFYSVTTPKFAAQAIKKLAEIDWHPLHIVVNVSSSIGAVIKPAGFENAQGILSATYAKDASDPQWDGDPGMKKFLEFLQQYYPDGNKLDSSTMYGYGAAQTLGEGAADVRRRSHPRQCDEAGRQPEGFRARHPAAGDHDEYLGDGFCTH